MGVNRKLTNRLIAAASAELTAAVLFAAPAAAKPDNDGYLSILRRAGVLGSDTTVLTLGNNACGQFRAGATFDTVAASIWKNTNYPAIQAGMIIEAAKHYLCPDVYDLPAAS